MNATAMLAEQSIMLKYYWRAQRELDEHDRLDDATDKDIEQLAHALRHQEFICAIEPYQRQRAHIISSWAMLQTRPLDLSQLPKPLRRAVADWDEMIAGVARQFGYRPEFGNAPDGEVTKP
jgi:hypothetical protein